MHKNIIRIKKEKSNYLIFSSEGMLLSLTREEFEAFEKHGKKKKINPEYKEILSRLASYGILEFEDFKPDDERKTYDLSLLRHNSSEPLYPAPVLAHLSVTNKCNMSCEYCSVRELHCSNAEKELTTEQWKKIISGLAEWGVFQIGFTGGEPTLRKDLPELANHVHEKGCVFNLTTNGWLLDEKLVSKLAESGMKQCQVSLDSHIKETHEKLRGKGSYERAIKSIRLLKDKGVAVGIDCVVSRNNIGSIPEFIKWIEKEGIPYLTLIKLKKGDLSREYYNYLMPDYHAYSRLIKDICCREKNKNPNITLDCGSVSNLQAVADKNKFHNLPVAGCPLGHHLICISPSGNIFSCAALLDKRLCLGNALKDDIKEVWENNSLLREFRLIKQKISGKCRNCERLDICRGGCRGISYSINNGLFGSDSTCKFQEVKNGNTG